ncbi:ABC transporter ATP-binding protein [Actinoplanes sp. NEAU-A12]|uniref:ABC transporter ATP-binding protein n=1 Tax=Actinoplanes sandaracinus TaxID=3045177 RepID=A0ABT6WX91_9ACTN|nr:ABC transporter ATP-binding protein [Actinoplanes sandaracinus]MDI6104314.1 ABC transporter ATP-binding protein [Actinoplanes sandaracinus]
MTKTYTTRSGRTQALSPINVSFRPDEFTAILGTSGCGKSTLLHIVAGLEQPSTGHIEVNGTAVSGPGRDRGMVFQNYTLFPWLTVQQNVEFALRDLPMSRRKRHDQAREYLGLVGMEAFAAAHPSELSGGMRQRVAIARALSYQPRVLLMDEPFGALDAQTRQGMQMLLTRVWEEHRMSVLFVTHDIEEAVCLSDRVIVMSRRPGAIKADLAIDIPRPRGIDTLTSAELNGYKAELLQLIREEADDAQTAASAKRAG